jgi:signal transduction histidine kinase
VTTEAERTRLALVVHEVRSSVAALTAIARAFSGGALDRDGRRELAGLAIAASRGIARIVADATVTSLRLERVDVGRVAAEAVAAARFVVANIRAEVDPDLPRGIDADPERLRQILDNLISNAVAYSPEGAEIVVEARADGASVVVSVSDAGAGISTADQARIFDPGVRLDARRPGSGLGLAISRAIAEAHGGTLSVESVPGKGSTFTLTLRAAG